jgi:hypothetical protein
MEMMTLAKESSVDGDSLAVALALPPFGKRMYAI